MHSLSCVQDTKKGYCVWDDHYEILGKEPGRLHKFLTSYAEEPQDAPPHNSTMGYSVDPASVGRMLFSLTPIFLSVFGERTVEGPLELGDWFGSEIVCIMNYYEMAKSSHSVGKRF